LLTPLAKGVSLISRSNTTPSKAISVSLGFNNRTFKAYRCSSTPTSIGLRSAIVTLSGSRMPKTAHALSEIAHRSTSNPFFIGVLPSA